VIRCAGSGNPVRNALHVWYAVRKSISTILLAICDIHSNTRTASDRFTGLFSSFCTVSLNTTEGGGGGGVRPYEIILGVDGGAAPDPVSRPLASNLVSLGCLRPISVGFMVEKVAGTGVTSVLSACIHFTKDRTHISFSYL
jgi:hypothetical protein